MISEVSALNAISPRGTLILVDTFPYQKPANKVIKSIFIPDGTDVELTNADGSTVTLTAWSFGRLDLNVREIVSSTNPLYVVLGELG